MSFSFPRCFCVVVVLFLCGAMSSLGQDLRVCADPDNLPFSSAKKNGFENELAEMVARELHQHLTYVWQRMGRGFVRDYITGSKCDLLIGIPNHYRAVDTTQPYYRSTYVFLSRKDAAYKPSSLDDPALRNLHIGVQALDEAYTPPGEVLVKRGLQGQLKAFHSVGGDAEDIIRAVLDRQVDVALVWGPLGGYAARQSKELQVTAVSPQSVGEIPFTFEISMGVKKGNESLRSAVQAVVEGKNAEIVAVLNRYGIPQLPIEPPSPDATETSSK
jgi:mxaJ protein